LIALWGAIASFALAALMAILVGFGIWHARRTPEDTEIVVHSEPEPEAERELVTV
jgi:hypothetical protein